MAAKNRWTAEQDAVVREQYAVLGAKAMAAKLGLTVDAVLHRARLLGVTCRTFEWSADKIEILKARYETDGPQLLAAEFGTTHWAVTAKARRLGIGSTRKTPPAEFEWTEDMLTAIKERYTSEAAYKLAEEFGVTLDTVRRKAASLGVHTIAGHAKAGQEWAEKSESSDIHYFDQWSADMAYVLGFMFADGCNSKSRCMRILLSTSDEAVLHFIRNELKVVSPIKRRDGHVDNRGSYTKPQSYLLISSTVLCQRLEMLGLHPRKTYNDDPFPNIPDDMLGHFVRGYFDGDGSACLAHNKRYDGDFLIVGMVGSPRFIVGIHDALVRVAGMSPKSVQHRKVKTACCTIAWTALRDLKAFYSFIYPDGFAFCLERKRRKLADWLSQPHREVVHRLWNEEEEQTLRDYYNSLGPTRVAEMLGRNKATVSEKAKRLGLIPTKEN